MAGPHVPATVSTLRWGRLPSRSATPVASVRSGQVFTVDTLSHEGALEDQGRDPVAYFARYGVTAGAVLADLVEAVPKLAHDPVADGPHLVTGPVYVEDAQPGDLLCVDIVALDRRTDYGVISDRHAKDVFAADPDSRPPGSAATGGLVSTFCTVDATPDPPVATLAGDDRLRIPLAPFLGIIGVAGPDVEEPHSGPPGRHGGNLDLRHLVVGTSIYLPVAVPGALLYVGDPHFVQGNGEVASTALEAPLTATLRTTVVPGHASAIGDPVARTPDSWIVCGLDRDLGRAVRAAAAAAVELLGRTGIGPDLALAWLSVAGDVEVTQVVDGVLGAHVVLPRRPGLELLPYEEQT